MVPLLAVLALVASACTPGRAAEAADDAADESIAAPRDEQTEIEQLVTAFDRESIVCDGAAHPLGEIRGALPGERILFSSPVPIDELELRADQSGRFDMVWRCDPNEARLQWEIKALGHDSGRAVTFTIVGSEADSLSDAGLTVNVITEPFTCDGFTRSIGTITDAFANEEIVFTSPETPNLKPGKTNQFGELDLNWECDPEQAGTTWNVSARGVDSGRAGQFAIAGVPIDPGTIEEIAVEVTEEPFLCDGTSRGFATLRNFAPFEVIDFSSPDSEGLIDAMTDGLGEIEIRWQCGLGDVGKVWRLTATGVNSQRTTTLVITGGEPPDDSATAVVTFIENPFGCDGSSRVFATISNLVPLEFVDFVSPQSGPLRQGQADAQGNLPIRWQCGAADIDKIWDVTATGATSGRAATLQITGAAPSGG